MKIIDKKEWKKIFKEIKELKFLKALKSLISYSWNSNDLISYFVFFLLIFIFYKILLIPIFLLIFKTKIPFNVIISESMEHHNLDFNTWWKLNGLYFKKFNITEEKFKQFSFINGLNVGDFVFILGKNKEEVKLGDIIVYHVNYNGKEMDVIHRVIKIKNESGEICFETLGDNNKGIQLPFERNICEIEGVLVFKIPYIGYPRYLFYKVFKI
jgi:signal peptidase I